MDIASNYLLIAVLLAANGFFVAAEFALVKARGFRIASASNEGSSAARLTVRIRANLEAYLAACQLGITMASLGLGWIGEPAVAAILEPLFVKLGVPDTVLHGSAFIVGFLLFSALHIVVGEQVPKTLAIRKAEPVSIWVAYPLHYCYLLVWPLNWLLNRASSLILDLLNVAGISHVEVFTGEEIQGMVSISQKHGEILERQAAMLHNLIEFDQRRVGRIMIPASSVQILDVSGDPQANLETLRSTNHSRFPLIDGDQNDLLIGVVLARDIHRALLNGEAEPWKQLDKFARQAMIVPESQNIARLFDNMRARRAQMACVVDEYGNFVGMVTIEDLLEEIVGEIEDENDVTLPGQGVEKIDHATWHVEGLLALNDAWRLLGLEVGDDVDANTIGGLFLRRLSRMPRKDDVIEESGFRLKVLEHNGRRVVRVEVTRVGETSA